MGLAKGGLPAGSGGDEFDLCLCDEFPEFGLDSGGIKGASARPVDRELLGADCGKMRGIGGALASLFLVVSPAGFLEIIINLLKSGFIRFFGE